MDAGSADPSDINSSPLDRRELQNVRVAVRYAMRTEAGRPASAPDLSGVDGPAFVRAVGRHRVGMSITPHLDALGVPDAPAQAIRAQARMEQLTAMQTVPALIQVVQQFEDHAIRLLVLKGTPLAVQTTGLLTSRGAGDLDLLVHPDDVVPALDVLARLGYRRVPGLSPASTRGAMWTYYRWTAYELLLKRGSSAIDLHWYPTRERGLLPPFDDLWQRRVVVAVGPGTVPTLGLADAFDHSCAHALKDYWKSMRSLIDVDRLARRIPAPSTPPRSGPVASTCYATFLLTGNTQVGAWAATDPGLRRRIVATVDRSQSSELSPSSYDWSPRGVVDLMAGVRMGATGPGDWSRQLVNLALPFRLFNDPETGHDIPFRSGIAARLREAGPKIRRTYRS